MSWRDRPYAQKDDQGGIGSPGGFYGAGGPMRVGLPRPGSVVRTLLIINFVAFFLQIFLDRPGLGSHRGWGVMSQWLGASWGGWWQLWRYVTFQFLHDVGGLWHLFLNMLALYMLGTPLEEYYGPRRFLKFYLSCGVVAGVAFVIVGYLTGIQRDVPIVGASGGVYGIILASAVYFPHFRLILLVFPVPIRVAAGLIFAVMAFTLLSSVSAAMHGEPFAFARAMSDVAHFGGAVTGGVWVLARRRRGTGRSGPSLARKIQNGRWKKKMAARQRIQAEADRILEKIHQQGIASLTGREKRLLKKATEQQRQEERNIRARGYR